MACTPDARAEEARGRLWDSTARGLDHHSLYLIERHLVAYPRPWPWPWRSPRAAAPASFPLELANGNEEVQHQPAGRRRRVHFAYLYKILYAREAWLIPSNISNSGQVALKTSRAFPASARREAGYQLDKVQAGHDPTDWKPMTTIGPSVREIRVRDKDGAFRVIYVAKFEQAIYVLHCFQKKSQATSKIDLNLAEGRYRDLLKELAP